ncbi:DUF4382 domain-containing protein [Chitinophaga agrisoli]|uniref:DUF4382 domain-containing protein n=1 Tax=Chitinophaga agrisoli TaxID=2607653 RepID=A0A5B2VVF3_9BACT|nr:DUF4382 domain-containing protein [Chitinophaga agrisoli]KAA2243045.1 DUF4382 domain-containing protein [Chitinophaga agrisoli]
MKNHLRNLRWPLVLLCLMAIVVYACQKDNSTQPGIGPNQQKLSIHLSDDPGFFDNVFLDIRKVEVLVDTCTSDPNDDDDRNWDWRDRCWWDEDRHDDKDNCQVWNSLGVAPGVYDVLSLRNGADTLLAGGIVPKGKVKKIRITLGNNNALVKDSVRYPLKSANGQVKIIVKLRGDDWDEVTTGDFHLWLDFDINRSIIKVRNGQFILRPFIVVFTLKTTGSLSGQVTPAAAWPVVTVANGTDTAYALPWFNGQFKVRGLKAGKYNVFINASNGYQDKTVNDITVERNKNTDVGRIVLVK